MKRRFPALWGPQRVLASDGHHVFCAHDAGDELIRALAPAPTLTALPSGISESETNGGADGKPENVEMGLRPMSLAESGRARQESNL